MCRKIKKSVLEEEKAATQPILIIGNILPQTIPVYTCVFTKLFVCV